MRAADPPYWYDFWDQGGRELGPDIARFTTLMAAYHAEMILRHKPASAWIVGTGSKRLGWFREPVLKVAGMGELPVTMVIVMTARVALRGDSDAADEPNGMRRWFDLWVPPGGDPPPIPDEPDEPDFSVESIADSPGGGRFGFLVAFDDVIAHEQEDRVAAFVERLGREPAIAEAVHEDREVVLVRAPGLTTEALEPIVARAWEEAASWSRRRIDVGPIV